MGVELVLEGGGMRGWYTCGVLTSLAEHGIRFPGVYGISAGALNALSYISGQNSREYNQTFLRVAFGERRTGAENPKDTGSAFTFDFLFGEMFHTLLPFDYDAFFRSPVNLVTGTTDLKSGLPVFYNKSDLDEDFTAVRASCSLPFVSAPVSFRGRELMDGGCSMPIPIEQSISDGNERNVIVLTRDASYRKDARPEYPRAELQAEYGGYPNFVETMLRRAEVYNAELEICSKEAEKKAVIIRPRVPITVGRWEADPEKLREIYELGIRDCEESLRDIGKIFGEAGA